MFWKKKVEENAVGDDEFEDLLKDVPQKEEEAPVYPVKVEEKGELKKVEKHRGLSFRDKLRISKNPTTTFLVTMIMGNGSCEHFVVEPDRLGFFKRKDRKYHINLKNVIWDANENNNRLFFHEHYVEPLDITDTRVDETESDRLIAYVTPENLDGIIRAESLRLIAEGPNLQWWVRLAAFCSIAVLVLLAIILIIMIAQSGIFQYMSSSMRGQIV